MGESGRAVSFSEVGGIFRNVRAFLDRSRMGELLVLRRKLSPWQLKEALSRQEREGLPLGRILVEAGWVSPTEIRWTRTLQVGIRCAAAVVTLMVSAASFTTSKSAWAGSPGEVSSSVSASYGDSSVPYSLFGTGERRSTDLSAFSKWQSVFDRFSRETSEDGASPTLASWKDDLRPMKNLSLEQMASGVNDLVNRVRYISDSRNWGQSDYWATPTEFFTRGGDCEDFAIAKYASLRALGVPDAQMRLAVVKDLQKNIPHAILIVYTESGPMVLDNQIKTMRRADSIRHYKPIFSINRSAWWLHTTGNTATQVASAAQ